MIKFLITHPGGETQTIETNDLHVAEKEYEKAAFEAMQKSGLKPKEYVEGTVLSFSAPVTILGLPYPETNEYKAKLNEAMRPLYKAFKQETLDDLLRICKEDTKCKDDTAIG